MLRLPAFAYTAPDSVDGVLAALAERPGRARLIAGGTDLLPNLKHGIEEAEVVVSLRGVEALRGIREVHADLAAGRVNAPAAAPSAGKPIAGTLRFGAMTTLEEIARHPLVRSRYSALAQAAGLVAGPHHRRMGTLGGNVCLNTRCVYINQTHFWRSALGYCLKKDGEACHVVKGGKRCVAAASNDTAPPLLAFGARLLIASAARGERELPLAEFFVKDGIHNKVLQPDELLVAVLVPPPAPRTRSAYVKLRPRDSIDFPRLGVAVAFTLGGGDGMAAASGEAVVHDLRIVVTALAAVPQALRDVGALAEGRAPGEELWAELAAAAHKQCHPLTNIDGDAAWRREMVPVFVRRALRQALTAAPAASP
ncbi:MAG: FAD binding domain-containing protein [Planctomycetota bacterium]